MCQSYKCPECNDRLIHQTNRGPNESSSAFGQFIHDAFPNSFWWIDVDGMIYKKATRILRVIEHKPVGGQLRPSQQFLLPMIATCIRILIALRLVHEQSGVFLVRSDPPFRSGHVQQIDGPLNAHLDDELWHIFLTGELFPIDLG